MNPTDLDQNHPDRLPPHSTQAEQGVLGCCLLDPVESIGQCIEKLPGGAMSFYEPRHQILYRELEAAHNAGQTVDTITFTQRLRDSGEFDAVGGFGYLAELQNATPSAAHLSHYLGIVRDKATLRQAVTVCSNGIAKAHDQPDNVTGLLDDLERDILAIGDERDTGTESTGEEMARGFVLGLEARMRGENKSITSGFQNLDLTLRGGFKPAQLVVIAGRPGGGKSAMITNVAIAVAAAGTPVGIFSLEMNPIELWDRIVSTLAGVDVGKFNARHTPTDEEKQAVLNANAKLSKLLIRIDDRPDRTVAQIRSIARRWKARHGVGLVVVDYLQLISPGHGQGKDRREQVDAISRGLKMMAKELDIPVIVAAQLNREIEKDKLRKPRLSDLRESGAIEQDADVVGMLYDPRDADAPEPGPYQPREVRLLVGKNRGGPAGADLRFTFTPTLTLFEVFSPIRPSGSCPKTKSGSG